MNWKVFLLVAGLTLQFVASSYATSEPPNIPHDKQPALRVRTPIDLPELPGLVTLKGDFHMHTVFSDGLVWPTMRVEEAWRQGLDAIAITDHIEYLPFKADVSTNRNRSYQIARDFARDLDMLVIAGSEVTRDMPPGHLNALFITNANALAVPAWSNALQIARDQGAFILWNHPGWGVQITDNKIRWYPEHTQLLKAGLINGIEIATSREYYPQAFRWATEKQLAVFGDSDGHLPVNLAYDIQAGDHRPVTVIFARERTVESIKEAFFARRTSVLWAGRLMGAEEFVRPLFECSIRVMNPSITIAERSRACIQIHNSSSIDFILDRIQDPADLSIPSEVVLPAHKTAIIDLRGRDTKFRGKRKIELPYRVRNVLTSPEQPLRVAIGVEIDFGDSSVR